MSHHEERELKLIAKELREIVHEQREIAKEQRRQDKEEDANRRLFLEKLKEIVQLLKGGPNKHAVVALKLNQLSTGGNVMPVPANILGLVPGATARFQVIPVDANGEAATPLEGTTYTYQSSDPTNAPISADPADSSGLTALVPVASSLAVGSSVTFTVTASAQKDANGNDVIPTTGNVPVPVKAATALVSALVLNQLS